MTLKVDHRTDMLQTRIEIMCVKMRLTKLKADREKLMTTTRLNYPIAFEKAESVESLASEEFAKIDKEIAKWNRLLSIKRELIK